MATARREYADSLIDLLVAEPYRFDSRQAVRVLEARQKREAGPGPRFRSSLSLAFPISDLESVSVSPYRNHPPVVTVSFLGLGGAMGPLPTPYTEYLSAGVRRKQTAGRDFLDLFNHRLVTSAMDQAKLFRPALEPGLPQQSSHARRLYALLGLAIPSQIERNPALAASLLPMAGLLNQAPRSAHAIERAVSSHFGVRARVIPFRGDWMQVPAGQRTALGVLGRNQRLGQTAMLGGRVWDQSANITLQIGPLPLDAAEHFLPPARPFTRRVVKPLGRSKGSAPLPQVTPPPAVALVGAPPRGLYRQMAELLDFLVTDTVGVEIRLLVETASLRPSRLHRAAPMRLGWTSRLNRHMPAASDPAVIVLRPAIAVPR